MSQTFTLHRATSRDGLIRRIADFLSLLPADRAWKVEVSEHRRKRSDQQNRYLWGVVYPAAARCKAAAQGDATCAS